MKIQSVSVTRLHSTGNFEHVKYEVTAQIDNERPGDVLEQLDKALYALYPRCGHSEHDIRRAARILEMPAGELSEYDQRELDTYRRRLEDKKQAEDRRRQALEYLNQFSVEKTVQMPDMEESY